MITAATMVSAAYAEGCLSENYELRMSALEKRVGKLEAILRNAAHVPPTESRPQDCNDRYAIDLRMAAVAAGFKCRTSRDEIYERVDRDNFGASWKGPDGLIWSDYIGSHSQNDAQKLCESLGGILPSTEDFERAEKYGFRDVLPNMEHRWFWSSSIFPIDSDGAHITYGAGVFNSDSGITFKSNRSRIYSVRCVAR